MNISCTVCGSADWITCAPGTDADGVPADPHPAREVPVTAWCLEHWPFVRVMNAPAERKAAQ